MIDEDHAWLTENSLTIYFCDGLTSNQQEIIIHNYDNLMALDPTYVWARGKADMEFYDGKKWKTMRDQSQYGFTHITTSDNDHIWAVGDGGIYPGTPLEE